MNKHRKSLKNVLSSSLKFAYDIVENLGIIIRDLLWVDLSYEKQFHNLVINFKIVKVDSMKDGCMLNLEKISCLSHF